MIRRARPDARATLDALATQMQKRPQCRFVIEGTAMSAARASTTWRSREAGERAMSYLAALGVDPTRMQTVSYARSGGGDRQRRGDLGAERRR